MCFNSVPFSLPFSLTNISYFHFSPQIFNPSFPILTLTENSKQWSKYLLNCSHHKCSPICMCPSFPVAVDKLSFLFTSLTPPPAHWMPSHSSNQKKMLQQSPFFSSKSFLFSTFNSIVPITIQIWCYFSNSCKCFFIWSHVSLWLQAFVFIFPDNKIPWNRCYAHYLQLFSLLLSWVCHDFISIALQKSFFLRSQTPCFSLKHLDLPLALNAIIHSPVHKALYLTSWTRHSPELPPLFSQYSLSVFLLVF